MKRGLLVDGVNLDQLRRVIGISTVAYISFPIAVWMLGWLRPALALIGTTALLAGVVDLARQFTAETTARDGRTVSVWKIAAVCIAVCAVVGLNGTGGFGIQTDDWLKHEAILSDLIDQPWPVAYRTSAGSIALVYYVAYYLPAALAGKLWGWTAANVALYLWTVFGCTLVVLWLALLSHAPLWLCVLGFTLFSGLDVVGGALRAHAEGEALSVSINEFRLEWWEGHWLFPGMLSLIAYVPQQATGGWLLTCLAMDRWRAGSTDHPFVLNCALALMWSPYVAIGLACLSVLIFAGDTRILQRGRGQLSIANCAGGVIATICGLYFLSRGAPVHLADAYVSPPSAFARGAFDVGLHGMGMTKFAQHYIASVLLEFLLLACILAFVYRRRTADRRIVVASTCLLLALPFVHHGHFNDLVMRAAIPPLFALLVVSLSALATPARTAARVALVTLLVAGAIHPANMLRRNAIEVLHRGALFQVPQVVSLFDLQRKVRDTWPYLYQYVCPLDAFFFAHLAAPATPIDRDP